LFDYEKFCLISVRKRFREGRATPCCSGACMVKVGAGDSSVRRIQVPQVVVAQYKLQSDCQRHNPSLSISLRQPSIFIDIL
jgi:hypothetical protein